jgi:hypothetical protein
MCAVLCALLYVCGGCLVSAISFDDFDSPYAVIREVVDTLDDSTLDDDFDGLGDDFPIKEVFSHTLYRQLVLLVASPEFAASFLENELYMGNAVWKQMVNVLDLHRIVNDLQQNRKKTKLSFPALSGKGVHKKSAAVQCFEADICQWSIHVGSRPVMMRYAYVCFVERKVVDDVLI